MSKNTNMNNNTAVALVTAHGWVGISTPVIMTATFLSRKGYTVDIFVTDDELCNALGIGIPHLQEENIHIYKSRKGTQIRIPSPPDIHISRNTLEFVSQYIFPPRQYDWIVGFDPEGLARAGLLSLCWKVPYIYHSLEIDDRCGAEKAAEKWFSQRALLTLTQDEVRANILSQLNGINRNMIKVVCNSSFGETLAEKSDYFYKKFTIPQEKKIVLATGTLLPITCIDQIIKSVDSWPDNFVLVLHGWIPDKNFELKVRNEIEAKRDKIFLSVGILSVQEKHKVFQSADIGLAFYNPIDTNLKFAAGSSGKIFDFMKAGVPIIGNDIPGMSELLVGNGCGMVVNNASEIGNVLHNLMDQYEIYKKGCLESFPKYEFGRCYEKLLNRVVPEIQRSKNMKKNSQTILPIINTNNQDKHQLTNENILRNTDILVASFPRSGNTWLRNLLADIVLQSHGINTDTHNWEDTDRVIPDLHQKQLTNIDERLKLPYRLIKTHDVFNPLVQKTIYIFGEASDSLCSYYHFLKDISKKKDLEDIDSFCINTLGDWYKHIYSYVHAYKSKGAKILFISYELLHEDSITALLSISEFLGIKVNKKMCERAVKNQEFQKHKNQSVTFYRKGIIGSGKEELKETTLEYIKEKTKSLYDETTKLIYLSRFEQELEREFNNLRKINAPKSDEKFDSFIKKTMDIATQAIRENQFETALRLIVMAKYLKISVYGLDYTRALSFLGMGQKESALEALKEELRYFPQNSEAKSLFENIKKTSYTSETPKYNSEFQEILDIIRPYTMVGEERLFTLYQLSRKICEMDVPGNFVECGVAGGGSSALLAIVIKRYSRRKRILFSFDSFEGMPVPTEKDTHNGITADSTGWGTGTCAASEENVRELCWKLGVLDVVKTVKGYFKDTLPATYNEINHISFLHMDGDWYESTCDILINIYDLVDSNGFIQVDDYGYWEGCRMAIHEFEKNKGIHFNIQKIDGTGVWFQKPSEDVSNIKSDKNLKLLNLGCGSHHKKGWVNVDFNSTGPAVIAHNLNRGIPFEGCSFDVVYHSHLLEHFSKSSAQRFMSECHRVLKDGGIIRVVVPDLEQIIKWYSTLLEKSLNGDQDAQKRYEWIMLELFDQMVRRVSGGEMLKYWKQNPMPAESFVIERCGSEVLNAINYLRNNSNVSQFEDHVTSESVLTPEDAGRFILSGQNHQWMYDRYSLPKLLKETGFEEIRICSANESRISNFGSYFMDIEPDGSVRKPDSLFVEAIKKEKPVIVNAEEKKAIKIVHLCMQDFGGAGGAAYRLHRGLLSIGVNSTMLVLNKKSEDPSVKVIPDAYSGPMTSCIDTPRHDSLTWQKHAQRWGMLLAHYPKRPDGLEVFRDADSDVRLDLIKEVQEADIINLHWVNGVFDCKRAPSSMAGKPIVWTIHDMNPFTGGCHYAGDCDRYKMSCGKCPQLGSEKEHDLSNIVWKKRNDAYPLLNVHIVSPSKWLAKCASESNLFSRFPVSVIPNGFPIDKFKPYPQKEAREFFGIEMSTNVILFGADSVVNKRKGFVYLLKALNNIICSEKQNILLITFGHIPDNIMINIQYPVKNFGHVSEKQLSIIYSMADLFVITSLEDNLPNTVLESMACGTPVVGFNIGGIPDMIEHKETGYLAKSKNVDDLAKGISWILSSSEETKSKLSKQCRKKAEELYALEIQANNYRRLYEELYEKQQSTLKETTELNEQAKQALQNGDVQSAKELLTKVLSQSPNNTKALNNLAVTKILEKDWKSAQETLQKVLQLDPSNQIALENQEYLHQKISETLTNEKKVISDTKKDGYLVSAVVSVYNSEEFIQGCLQTLVEQTIYEKGLLEIIVVDTGSEHDEMSVVESYQQRYSHIKYIRTEERETIYKAWNRGAQAAFGKYIVNTNTDDRLRRDALERMADVLECREDVGIVYIDQILTEHPNETFNRHHKDGFLRRPDFSMEVIVQRNPCGPQVMWRKCLHELVGYFNPAYEVAGDWDFWLRVVFNTEYTIYHIPELLGLYYYNKKGLEHGGRKQLERQREIAEIKKTYPYPPGQCAPVKYPAYTDTRRNGHFQTGKRILLATSAAPSQSPFSTIEKRPPIGLGFLISVLRNAGHEVFFIDNYLQPNNFLETDYLQRNKIDYVGIYANTICYRDTLRMFYKLDYLRRTGRWRGKIMVGGPHTTVALHTIPDFVDYIIQGEGERAILDIVEDKVKDRVVRYPTIKNLDELPMPAWDYFIRQPYKWGVEWFRETPVFTLNTSRGCPFKCTFCSVMSIWGKQYTYFSAERIVSDIEYLIKNYGAKGFYFREDNFTLNKKRLTTFCNLLIEKKINIPWACETRVNTIDREIVELMHSAGARAFYFGVESGSQKILDFFKKDITIEQTRDAFRLCHEFGIKTAASVIVGVPPETEDDIVQTIRLVEEIKPTVTWYNVFVGIPDSELYKYVKKNKLYEFADDRGLLYLKGHNERVRRFYGNQWNAYVPIDINNPKISVVMSVYNGGKYLEDSVKSILTQTYQDFEFIIVNDASTDDSLEIIKKIEDCRLRIITNPENIGLTKSLNKGIQLARGEYIARMDVDDISLPHRFETQVNFLEKNPDYALVGSSYYQIDKDNKTNALINVLTDNAQIKQGMTKQNWFGHGSVMMRKYVFLQVGGYDERFQLAQDYDLWLRIAECYKVANIAEPLYKWRTTKSGISVEKEAEQKHYASLAISEAKKRNHPKIARNGTQHPSNTLQTNPLVSVIVPTYNRPDTLKTTLDSIAAQTYKNIETIVVNDAGGDVSGVIDTFHDRLSVRYLVHHKNKGLGASRNTGINAATGKYIAYLDDDDIYYPDHIETLVCFLETSYYKVAYTDAYRTHQKKENGKYIVKKKDIPYSFDFDSDLILAQNLMPVLCIMHERSCTDEVGLFDESLTTHEDWDLWVRMSRKYKFAHIKRVTCEFAWKTDSTTMSSEKRSDFLRTMVIIYKRYWEFSKDKQRVLELQRECTRCLQLELKQTVNSCYPRVSFIIPVFNKIEFIRKCLDAIVKNTLKESFEVIIIDNASTDSTKDFLKCLEGDVKIVTNDKNLGFARACNQGARMASSDYLLFLNNDTEPQKGWLGPLLEVLIRDNSVAAAGSKLLFSNETIQHAGVVIADNKNVNDPLLATHIYAKEPANLPEANQLRTYQALTAACLLIRKSVFNEVGGFDEGYWNGYEDVDLCFKLQERGWKLVYQPESVVIHHESKSGQERFIKVNENIKRLHDKWQGKIKPDIIIKEDGSTIVTENNKIKQYSLPNELPTEAANIKSQKLVSIIMLTWNALEYTQKCIRSIQDYTHYPYEVVFVDNGSSDGTVEYLRKIVKEHPNYKLIDNQENKGFAAGNNQGVKLASGKYIMLLNNDVLVSEGWLENLVESLERDEKIGMVGPITNSISGRQQVKDVPYADEMLKLQKGTKYKGDIHRNENNSSFFSASYVVEDGFFDEKGFHRFAQSIRRNFKGRLTPRYRIAGFAIFMKKSLYEEVGGLDESFGTGNYEDDDLCLKVRDKGYAVMVDESVFIHHYRSQTFKENKIDYKNSIITNDTKFKEKWPEVDYTELLELHTKLVDTNAMLIKQGQQALNTGYTRKAFDFYSSVLKTNPIDESAIYGIGLVHQMEGNIEKAIDSYNKALKINPAFYEAYYNLGILYSKTSNINNAITALSKAIEVNNNDASVYNNLGVLYFKKKVFREARACFENALAIDPDYQEAKQNLEKVLENVGNTTQPGIGQE